MIAKKQITSATEVIPSRIRQVMVRRLATSNSRIAIGATMIIRARPLSQSVSRIAYTCTKSVPLQSERRAA